MKKILCVALMMTMLVGCTSKTQYGHCIGITEKENATLHYKVSAWNVFLAIIFSETIIVPVLVLADEVSCPVGPAEPQNKAVAPIVKAEESTAVTKEVESTPKVITP